MKKTLILMLAMILALSIFTACEGAGNGNDDGSGVIPSGAYSFTGGKNSKGKKITDSAILTMYSRAYSVVVDGNVIILGKAEDNNKYTYTYNNGKLKLNGSEGNNLNFSLTYKNDILYWHLADGTILEFQTD